jgi:hypothetical protein
MILLQCPQCGRQAEGPDNLAADGGKCYSCGVAMVGTQLPTPSPSGLGHRVATVWGALAGATLIAVLGTVGGPAGLTLAGAVAGALAGAMYGLVECVLGGVELAVVSRDPSRLTSTAWLFVALGLVGGMILGAILGEEEQVRWLVLGGGALGGAYLGGLAGAWLGARRKPA